VTIIVGHRCGSGRLGQRIEEDWPDLERRASLLSRDVRVADNPIECGSLSVLRQPIA
jgi:hypothetical protein